MQQGKKGIIYKYTSPSGKIYIGQTTKEKHENMFTPMKQLITM